MLIDKLKKLLDEAKRNPDNTFEIGDDFFKLKGVKDWYEGLKKQGIFESLFDSLDEFKKHLNRDEIKNIVVKECDREITEEELDRLIEQAYQLHKEDFDGTLSDLGELPKYAYGTVGDKGGSDKLVTKTKKIKGKSKRKKRKSESIDEEDECTLKTIVREFPEGDIILLFPEDYNPVNKTIGSYMHVGQHGDASVFLIDDLSRPSDETKVYRLIHEYEKHYSCKLEIIDYMSPADIIKSAKNEDVSEEIDNRKEVAKRVKLLLTKKFGKVSVTSGKGKTPYISAILKGSDEFPEDFRILCLKTVYPSFRLGGDSPWSTVAGNVHRDYITMKAPEWERVLDTLNSSNEEYSDSSEEPDYGMSDEEVYEGINGFIYFDNVKKKYYVTDSKGKSVEGYFEDSKEGFSKAMELLQSLERPKNESFNPNKFIISKDNTTWDNEFDDEDLRQLLIDEAEKGEVDLSGLYGVEDYDIVHSMPLNHVIYELKKAGFTIKTANQNKLDQLRTKLKNRPFDVSKARELEKKYFSR